MKKRNLLLLFVLLLSFNSRAFSQTLRAMLFNSNVYRTYVPIKCTRIMDSAYNPSNDATVYTISVERDTGNKLLPGQQTSLRAIDFKIVSEDDNGYVIIKILPCVTLGTGSTIIYDKDCKSTPAHNYYYAIKKSDLTPLSKVPLSNKIIGTPLVFPVKFRPSKGNIGFTMTGEFTAGYAFGFRKKLSKSPYSQSFISFIPLVVGVSAGKYFRQKDDGTYSDKSDSWSISYSYGIMFTVQKVNFGVFGGLDHMVGDQKDWFYQGSSWYSLGLGYKFKSD